MSSVVPLRTVARSLPSLRAVAIHVPFRHSGRARPVAGASPAASSGLSCAQPHRSSSATALATAARSSQSDARRLFASPRRLFASHSSSSSSSASSTCAQSRSSLGPGPRAAADPSQHTASAPSTASEVDPQGALLQPVTMTTSTTTAEMLEHTVDRYGGVIVDHESFPSTSEAFAASLVTSLNAWIANGVRGVWLKIPTERAELVGHAVRGRGGGAHDDDHSLVRPDATLHTRLKAIIGFSTFQPLKFEATQRRAGIAPLPSNRNGFQTA